MFWSTFLCFNQAGDEVNDSQLFNNLVKSMTRLIIVIFQ